MTLTQSDQNGLILPLFEGLFEVPLWDAFLRNLAVRTGATRARLVVGRVPAPGAALYTHHIATSREPAPAMAETAEAALLDLLPFAGLRPNRVYALDELLDYDSSERRGEQDATLKTAQVRDMRYMRVSGNRHYWLSLTLLHDHRLFDAADSALLTNLAPALEAAMRSLKRVRQAQMRARSAETTLAQLGIGQAVLDRQGQTLATDALWHESYAGAPGALAEPAAAIAGAASTVRSVHVRGERDILIRPWEPNDSDGPETPVAIASLRIGSRELGEQAATIVAASLGLSKREAALATLLCQGMSLTEAGRSLNLTEETARNYSKRIYAKTGTRGQADLVGAVLSGLAPLG